MRRRGKVEGWSSSKVGKFNSAGAPSVTFLEYTGAGLHIRNDSACHRRRLCRETRKVGREEEAVGRVKIAGGRSFVEERHRSWSKREREACVSPDTQGFVCFR